MRSSLLACFCLGVLLATAHAAPTPAEDEAALLQIEREACNAYLRGDADYLGALFTDDFSAINGRAELNDKAAELAEIRGKQVHYTVFENHDMQLHRHGDTAVVIGSTLVAGTPEGGKPFSLAVRFTDVFIRIDGKWRMVAGHSSRFPEGQASGPAAAGRPE